MNVLSLTLLKLITLSNLLYLVDSVIVPIKVFRLGRYQKDKLRSVKAIISSTSNIFEI